MLVVAVGPADALVGQLEELGPVRIERPGEVDPEEPALSRASPS
jgi:hypothetical protein